DCFSELRSDLLVAGRLEDPGLRLHHLGVRPIAHALAIRQRASLPPEGQLTALLDRPEELADKAALAGPGNADQRHELRRTLLPRTREGAHEQFDLPLAPDERRLRLRREANAEARP